MSASLVGSEMCIRDRVLAGAGKASAPSSDEPPAKSSKKAHTDGDDEMIEIETEAVKRAREEDSSSATAVKSGAVTSVAVKPVGSPAEAA
eukprot:12602984-Alexandrium_andersonii.AAC.1